MDGVLNGLGDPRVQELLRGLVHGATGVPYVPGGAPSSPVPGPYVPPAVASNPAPSLGGGMADYRDPDGPGTVPSDATPASRPGFGPSDLLFPSSPPSSVPGPYVPRSLPPDLLAAFGLTPATPSLRDKADALYAQADAVETPEARRPAFRSIDLLGLLPALLAGKQGGGYLEGFLSGKENYAAQDNASAARDAETRRAGLYNRAGTLMKAADAQDLIQGRSDVADEATRRSLGTQGLRNEGSARAAQIRGAFALLAQNARGQSALDVAHVASQDKTLAQLLKMGQSDVPEERAIALVALRTDPNYSKWFGSTTDAQISAALKATAKEQKLMADADAAKARAQDLRIHAGYLGALESRVEQLTPVEVEQKRAAITSLRAKARESMSRIGVNAAQAGLINQKAMNYSSEFRLRYSEVQARILKLSNDPSGSAEKTRTNLLSLYRSQASIAKDQISRILKLNGEEEPDENSPHYLAYSQAVHDEEAAQKAIKNLAKSSAMSPVTAGQPAAPSYPGSADIEYVGGNPNLMVHGPNGDVRIQDVLAEANQAVRDGRKTRDEALAILRRAGATVR